MAICSSLLINVKDLLLLQGVETQRVEFKKAWHGKKEGGTYWQIIHSICAFANDFYNDNGGYIMHLSMLSCRGGRPGIGGGFELRSFFLFKCPTPGTLSLVKRVQIPHPPPLPEKGQGIGQTRIKIGIYRNYKVVKSKKQQLQNVTSV